MILLCGFVMILFGTAGTAQDIVLCNAEKNFTCIVYGSQPSPEARKAALRLQYYFEQVTGKPIAIKDTGPCDKDMLTLWIGNRPGTRQQRFPQGTIQIFFADSQNIVINGAGPRELNWAVSEFLETFLGIRWLMPTQLGTHIPSRPVLTLTPKSIFYTPPFISRRISGLKSQEVKIWADNLKTGGHLQFGHNLFHLFPPETYVPTHPEFFPMKNGVRHLPANNTIYRWQPCFSAPGLVHEAVKNIATYFETHPNETSYSLSINDSTFFCECPTCRASYGKKKNIFGFNDASELYYSWVNRVVSRYCKQYPHKQFGVLAYLQCSNAPRRPLHPGIIPVMTSDRAKWMMRSRRRKERKLTRAFLKNSEQLGWYDYFFGAPYLLPRMYPHQMAENLRWAAEKRIRYQFAEAYPNFGEGPKCYLALKLLWNPDLNVDQTLNEWYKLAVGSRAAIPLKAYFDHWEDFWTRRISKSPWLTDEGHWMWFGDPAYLEEVREEDMILSRRLLEETLAAAPAGKKKERAGIMLTAFEYYEASVYAYLGMVLHRPLKHITPDKLLELNQRRYRFVAEYKKNPLLQHAMPFDKRGTLDFSLLNWQRPEIRPVTTVPE